MAIHCLTRKFVRMSGTFGNQHFVFYAYGRKEGLYDLRPTTRGLRAATTSPGGRVDNNGNAHDTWRRETFSDAGEG